MSFERVAPTGAFYCYVEDVEAWWEGLRQHESVKVAYLLAFVGDGRQEFAIYDCNGYALQFGQEGKGKGLEGGRGLRL
jgi:hypothetical protein